MRLNNLALEWWRDQGNIAEGDELMNVKYFAAARTKKPRPQRHTHTHTHWDIAGEGKKEISKRFHDCYLNICDLRSRYETFGLNIH